MPPHPAPARGAGHIRAGLVIGALLAGCGGASRAARPGVVGVEAAALPFKILRGQGGQEIAPATFFTELAGAAAVCVGESHTNPHHHWAQLRVLDELSSRGGAAGRELALGLEMVQRPYQGVLDDWLAGRIDEAALLSRSGWKERWGFDFKLYRPMVVMARARRLAVLALNAPKEITRKVAREGLGALSVAEKAGVPELVLDDADHLAYFKAATEGHEMPRDSFQNYYAAQVVWDETMADGAARWVTAAPKRQVVILAGTGHCHATAIPGRLRRRGVALALSVQPVIDDGAGNVADLLARPENDYLLVMTAK